MACTRFNSGVADGSSWPAIAPILMRFGSRTNFSEPMLGVRRASVSEVLHPLQEAGLVDSVRGKITILNRPGLEAAVVRMLPRNRRSASPPAGRLSQLRR